MIFHRSFISELMKGFFKGFIPLLFAAINYIEVRAQDPGGSALDGDSLRNSVGVELFGRLPLYSISYRRKMGDSIDHMIAFHASYLGGPEVSFSPSYSFLPWTIGIFRLKVGLSSPHTFALWRSKGEEPIPGGRHTPFYEWAVLGIIGTHFAISDRVTIDLDFLPRIYSETPFLPSNDFGRWADQDAIGGIQVAYRF